MSRVAALVLARVRTTELAEVIAAVQGQTRPPEEILILDNASEPPVKELLARLSAADERIEILPSERNLGSAGGFAAGAAHLAERDDLDYLWMLDDDAVPDLDVLETLLEVAPGLEDLGGVGPVSGMPGAELAWQINVVGRDEPVTTASELRRVAGDRRALAVRELAWHAMLVPIGVIRRLGPPRADLFHWYEDVEWGLRLRRAGLREYVVPTLAVRHPPPPQLIEFHVGRVMIDVPLDNPTKSYLLVRNSLVVRHEYAGRRFWWTDLPLTLLRSLVLALKLPGPRLRILRHVLVRGVVDAVRGRMGPPPPAVVALTEETR